MTSKEYLASIEKNPNIHPDELHTEEFLLTRSRKVKDAKHLIEGDLCEKRTFIAAVVEEYKAQVTQILLSRKHNVTKGSLIDELLEEEVIPKLNEKQVFESTCSHPYEQVFFRKGHILAHCPGDSARDALVKFFIHRVHHIWRVNKNRKIIGVQIEHSDGQCEYHTALLDL